MNLNVSRKLPQLRIALWLLIIAEAILVFALIDHANSFDARKYLTLAHGLAEGFYGMPAGSSYIPEAVRPPGYPILLWMVLYVLKLPLLSVVVIHFILYLASIYLAQRLLLLHNISPLVFLILVLLYPFIASYAARVQTEAVSTFLIMAITYLLARPQPLRTSAVTAIGVMAGFAVLVRPDILLLPFGLSALIFFRQQAEQQPKGKALLNAGLLVLAAGLVLTPYALHNYRVFEVLSPLPPAGAVGNSLYFASWQWEINYDDIISIDQGQPSAHLDNIGFTREVARINTSIGVPPATIPTNPEYYPTLHLQLLCSRIFAREALHRIATAPGDYAKHIVVSWWRLWITAEYPARMPLTGKILLKLSAATACALGLGGAVFLLVQRQSPLLKVLALILLYFPLVHCWLHTEARYTASARPLLLLTASLLIAEIYKLYAQRKALSGQLFLLSKMK